jgi:hypothetical protein
MIDVVNPINRGHPLNRDIDFWAMALPGIGASAGLFPELAQKKNGLVKALANPAPPTGFVPLWHYAPGQTINQAHDDIPNFGTDGASQYAQFDQYGARSAAGSLTVTVCFYSPLLSTFNTIACGRRTSTGGFAGSNAAWYLQNRTTVGLGLTIKTSGGAETILSHGFNGAAGVGYWVFSATYDANSLRITTHLRGERGRSFLASTMSAARDPHTGILINAGEFNTTIGDFGVKSTQSLRLWSRALSETELDDVYLDAANNYKDTLCRTEFRARRYFFPTTQYVPPTPPASDVFGAVVRANRAAKDRDHARMVTSAALIEQWCPPAPQPAVKPAAADRARSIIGQRRTLIAAESGGGGGGFSVVLLAANRQLSGGMA